MAFSSSGVSQRALLHNVSGYKLNLIGSEGKNTQVYIFDFRMIGFDMVNMYVRFKKLHVIVNLLSLFYSTHVFQSETGVSHQPPEVQPVGT